MKRNKQLKYSNYVVFNHFHGIVVNNSGLDTKNRVVFDTTEYFERDYNMISQEIEEFRRRKRRIVDGNL
jgi:hypothetical protein